MLYETQTSRTIVYDHRLIAGTMGIIFAAVNQCYPSESGEKRISAVPHAIRTELPPNKRGWQHRLHIGYTVVLRTDGRAPGGRSYGWTSDVITKPKFLAFTGYQILLAMGLRARSSAIIFKVVKFACR